MFPPDFHWYHVTPWLSRRLLQYPGWGLSPTLLHSHTTCKRCTHLAFSFGTSSEVPIAYLTTLYKCLISTLLGIYFAHNVFLLGCCSTWANGKTIHTIFQDKDLGVNFDSLMYYTPSIQKCGPFSSPSHRWHFPHLFLLLLSKTWPMPSSVWLAVPYPNAHLCACFENAISIQWPSLISFLSHGSHRCSLKSPKASHHTREFHILPWLGRSCFPSQGVYHQQVLPIFSQHLWHVTLILCGAFLLTVLFPWSRLWYWSQTQDTFWRGLFWPGSVDTSLSGPCHLLQILYTTRHFSYSIF